MELKHLSNSQLRDDDAGPCSILGQQPRRSTCNSEWFLGACGSGVLRIRNWVLFDIDGRFGQCLTLFCARNLGTNGHHSRFCVRGCGPGDLRGRFSPRHKRTILSMPESAPPLEMVVRSNCTPTAVPRNAPSAKVPLALSISRSSVSTARPLRIELPPVSILPLKVMSYSPVTVTTPVSTGYDISACSKSLNVSHVICPLYSPSYAVSAATGVGRNKVAVTSGKTRASGKSCIASTPD